MGETDGSPTNGAIVVTSDVVEKGEQHKEKDEGKDKDAEKEAKQNAKKRKAMAPRSDVWECFTNIFEGGVLRKAKCRYCNAVTVHLRKMIYQDIEVYVDYKKDEFSLKTQEMHAASKKLAWWKDRLPQRQGSMYNAN